MNLVSRVCSGVPDEIIGPDASPYMLRWFVFKYRNWPRVYLHKFVRSDDDRALHDHPWWFVSLILWGSYKEFVAGERFCRRRRAGSVAFRRADHAHRVELDVEHLPHALDWENACSCCGRPGHRATCHCDYDITDPRCCKPVWTLVLTGTKRREWGFHCPQGWRHWTEFVGVRGCD